MTNLRFVGFRLQVLGVAHLATTPPCNGSAERVRRPTLSEACSLKPPFAECGGIEPPRPYYGRKPVLKTGRATRPTHSWSYGRVYYIACLWRRVSTLKSPVRLVTPQASEYSSQAWAYLRLVPRLSR